MLGILEKISPSELVPNRYISNHNKVRRPRPKFKVSFFPLFFLLFLNQCYSNKLGKHPQKYKESFLIVVSTWNHNLMLMLERPLSHYWTSPLNNSDMFEVSFPEISITYAHYHLNILECDQLQQTFSKIFKFLKACKSKWLDTW